jgi:hypothetical protein
MEWSRGETTMASSLIDVMPDIPQELTPERRAQIAFEKRKSRMLRLWIVLGIFFMLLPGTILGVSNLVLISLHHGFRGLSPAWIQAHGHSQVFGWIGSFVLGIGFYSQPRTRANSGKLPAACWTLWALGLTLHWLAGAYLWHWRVTLPVSEIAELGAMFLFLYAASQHKLPEASAAAPGGTRPRAKIEPWMQTVLVSNFAMFLALALNFAIGVQQAMYGATPARPHGFDERYLVLLGWGFLAPLVWGFSARWVPIFLGVEPVRGRVLQLAVVVDLAGVTLGLAGEAKPATLLLAAGATLAAVSMRVFERPQRPAKTIGVHRSFPIFLRTAYAYSIAAALLGIWAAWMDRHNGIWGASRHTLTVGFIALMVMTVGPRILPHFAGVRGLYSTKLMFVTLALLLAGCTLRVTMEPLAYEGYAHFAWKLLPYSGFLELGAVLLFAAQLVLTFTRMPSVFADLS